MSRYPYHRYLCDAFSHYIARGVKNFRQFHGLHCGENFRSYFYS